MYLHKNRKYYISIFIVCAVFVLGLIYFRKFVIESISIIVVAGILSLLLSPLCTFYERHTSSPIAALLSLLTALFILLISFTVIVIPVFNSLASLCNIIPDLVGSAKSYIDIYAENYNLLSVLPKTIPDGLVSDGIKIINRLLNNIISIVGSFADITIASAVAWYMLAQREHLLLQAELLIPPDLRHVILKNAKAFKIELMLYLRGQSIIAVCVGILSALGLLVIGIDNAIPLGFTAGLLNMIPYLGPVIACIPVGLLALIQGFIPLILSIGVLISVQQIDGLILSPRIVGTSTGFPPFVVMIVIFSAGAVWGILGMLVIMPIMILFRTCVRVFIELRQNY